MAELSLSITSAESWLCSSASRYPMRKDLASDLRRPGRRGLGRLRVPDRRVRRAAGRELRTDRRDRHARAEHTLGAASLPREVTPPQTPNSSWAVSAWSNQSCWTGQRAQMAFARRELRRCQNWDSHGPDPRARPCAVVTSMRAQLVGRSYRVLHRHRPGVASKVVASRSPG